MPRITSYQVLRDITSPHESRPDRHYQIRLGRDGVTYCTCPGWRFRRTCRHLTEYEHGTARPSNNDETWINHNATLAGRPLTPQVARQRAETMQQEVEAYTARTRTERAVRRNQAGPTGPASVGNAPVFQLRVKYWNVYEGGQLVGKVTGTSKEAVLAMFIRTSGKSLPILVKETR